jgi:hypothetical protein
MMHIWIIGASNFGCDVAVRFMRSPGEGNVLQGFIDDRLNVLEQAKTRMLNIDTSLNYMTPDDHDFLDPQNVYLFGLSDPQFKASFFKRYILSKDRLHRFDQSPDLFQPLNLDNGQYWNCNISGFTAVGYGCFIDAISVIGHSVVIGNFCHIGVGVFIGGESKIGDACHIHSGAIIGRGIVIGDNCVVGSGAVVLRDLPDNSKVIAPKSVSI